jgi:hypothetical protein
MQNQGLVAKAPKGAKFAGTWLRKIWKMLVDGVGNERPDPLGEFMDKGGIYAARAASALPHENGLDLRISVSSCHV